MDTPGHWSCHCQDLLARLQRPLHCTGTQCTSTMEPSTLSTVLSSKHTVPCGLQSPESMLRGEGPVGLAPFSLVPLGGLFSCHYIDPDSQSPAPSTGPSPLRTQTGAHPPGRMAGPPFESRASKFSFFILSFRIIPPLDKRFRGGKRINTQS